MSFIEDSVEMVFNEKKIPSIPWHPILIEKTLSTLALMDTNNFEYKSSVGEREGRCYSEMVSKRHFRFTHGIGRSGDLSEPQPKAAGSSILYQLTNSLVKDYLFKRGFFELESVLVPLSRDMTALFSLLAVNSKRGLHAEMVLCFKTNTETEVLIRNAGFNPIVFVTVRMEDIIKELGEENINCLIINTEESNLILEITQINSAYKIPMIFIDIENPIKSNTYLEMNVNKYLIIHGDIDGIFSMDATIVSSNDSKMMSEFRGTYPGRATISSVKKNQEFVPNISQGILSKGFLQNVIKKSYFNKGVEGLRSRTNMIQNLFIHKKIPDFGWSNTSIEYLLRDFTTQFPEKNVAEMILRRHYNFTKGLNLSKIDSKNKQINSEEVLYNLTVALLEDLFKMMGIEERLKCMIVPFATGMSLVLSLLSFRKLKPNAKYVIWSRIDQKSCLKSILTAGLIPVIIDMEITNKTNFSTNLTLIEKKIESFGSTNILCAISTTSCFAPRTSDDLEGVSKICKKYNLFHLVNNAYGLTSKKLMKRIHRGKIKGNLDVFIQSTDKNLLVPVGGAIIAAFNSEQFEALKSICTGKNTISTTLDVLITLLSMGKNGYSKLVSDREEMYEYLREKLQEVATRHDEEIIGNSYGNPISLALTLRNLNRDHVTLLGSCLYQKNVFGAKVVTSDETKKVCGHKFEGWGSHSESCNFPYIACAAALGVTRHDIDIFISKLEYLMMTLKHKA